MRICSMAIMKRLQSLASWNYKEGGGVMVISVLHQRRIAVVDCWSGATILRQLLWKLKSQWRQAIGSHKDRLRFSYDPHSYSQNFDDVSVIDVVGIEK
ncbi:hypothetical protein ACLOJK_007846 [Asimina triloba]